MVCPAGLYFLRSDEPSGGSILAQEVQTSYSVPLIESGVTKTGEKEGFPKITLTIYIARTHFLWKEV